MKLCCLNNLHQLCAYGFQRFVDTINCCISWLEILMDNWGDYNQKINRTMHLQPRPTTMAQALSSKTVLIKDNPNLKSQIREYFLNTYSIYEKLFELLADDKAYYIRAQPLRHPLIFYLGHTACLYVNKFLDHGIIKQRINQNYEKMFAVGVDEMDWDDLNESHYDWPTVQQTLDYRNQVKNMVLKAIDSQQSNKIDNWLSNLWVVLLGIEHERIHLETSAVIMRRVPLQLIKRVEQFIQCQYREVDREKVTKNKLVEVAAWKATWERSKQNATTFGWDNQFGLKQFDVQPFQATQMLVSNAEFYGFVEDGGYSNPEWWTDEGKRWIASIKPTMPLFWHKQENKYQLRVLSGMIDMPWDWPAEVNNLEARAFCKWKSSKLGTYVRLPTEDEYYAIRNVLKKDHTNWEYQEVGNINMEYWMSANPVNMFKTGDFYDVVGNVWQHTITPTYPFQGFEIHPVYEDFTTPTFDQRHDMIKGGSFISTGNEALYHSRYAFRRHFYQFAGFRYIKTDRQMQVDLHSEQISDKNVEMNLKHHYVNNRSYVVELSKVIADKVGNKAKNTKILTIGCSVGRVPLELSKAFKESIGVDYTTRYFQMSTRLKEKGVLKFKDIDISLQDMGIDASKVELFQMNPENPDEKKINDCDWIVIDGFSVKKNTLSSILKKVSKLGKNSFNLAVLNVPEFNCVSKEEGRNILSKTVNGDVIIGEEQVLSASSDDQTYLPGYSKQVEFRVIYYSVIEP